MDNNKNFLVFLAFAILIIVGFNYVRATYFPQPVAQFAPTPTAEMPQPMTPAPESHNFQSRDSVLQATPRVHVQTPQLVGSINLKGARFDDLKLAAYKETIREDSPLVTLLSPSGSAAPYNAYYAEFSWLADGTNIDVPTGDTMWQSDGSALTPTHSIKLTWKSPQGLLFAREISVDENYMFTVVDNVTNAGPSGVTLYPFGLVMHQGDPVAAASTVSFEGLIGVLNGTLEEYKYTKLISDGKDTSQSDEGGWLGFSSKYWLVAMIPDGKEKLSADFLYDRTGFKNPGEGNFQSDFRGAPVTVQPGTQATHTVRFFAGAKKISLLDHYADKYEIPHFDRAIDFGWFYFLTKPFLYFLNYLGKSLGSLGIAILVFTVMLKLVTLPLSLKSNHSMARMKALQPETQRLKERYAGDQVRLNQEMMALFKREKVSPASGCLPMIIQIPIFFALYKVLYIGIEMRQAPFFGWIRDMSVPDPTSWYNIFGVGGWELPAQVSMKLVFFTAYFPPALHIGLWPILMGCSMLLQQMISPQTMDKSQAQMFRVMPVFFTYMLSSMPAGLVIYWTWSNLFSIGQQWFIMKRDTKGRA